VAKPGVSLLYWDLKANRPVTRLEPEVFDLTIPPAPSAAKNLPFALAFATSKLPLFFG
jgi:hypothetical protein